jgi:hypothetical protein
MNYRCIRCLEPVIWEDHDFWHTRAGYASYVSSHRPGTPLTWVPVKADVCALDDTILRDARCFAPLSWKEVYPNP